MCKTKVETSSPWPLSRPLKPFETMYWGYSVIRVRGLGGLGVNTSRCYRGHAATSRMLEGTLAISARRFKPCLPQLHHEQHLPRKP